MEQNLQNLETALRALARSKHRKKYIETEARSLLLFSMEQTFSCHASGQTCRAVVQIGFSHGRSFVSLQLSGIILLEAEKDFSAFIKKIDEFSADIWQLRLKDLKIMSSKAFWSLVKLARKIKQYGAELEIIDINPILLELLLEHRVCKHFKIKIRKENVFNEFDLNLM